VAKCIENLLVYGLSGSGKTTQVGDYAFWIHRKTGKKLRLASTSGGDWTSIQAYVDAGIVEPWFVRDWQFPFETMGLVARGYWPEHVDDPQSPLLAPASQKNWKDVGGLAHDGLSETAEWMQQDATKREADGTFKLSSEKLPARFTDGKTSFGAPSMAGYGMIQNVIAQQVAALKKLDGLYVMCTALELKVQESESGQRMTLYGPQIIGQAKTAIASAWFGNTLHIHYVMSQGAAAMRRMYLRNHYDVDKVLCLAKNRGARAFPLPEYLEGDNLSVGVFLDLLAESQAKDKARLEKLMASTAKK
jgi:hypothetical protein